MPRSNHPGNEDDAPGASDSGAADEAPAGGWRYWLGFTLLVVSQLLPVLALIFVPIFGFPKDVNTILIGLSAAGGPTGLLFLSIAIMGKDNLDFILGKYLPRLKSWVRWDTVTRGRYVFGLRLLIIAWVVSLAIIYLFDGSLEGSDGKPQWGFYTIIATDLGIVTAVLIMGAPLWVRLQALFSWDAEISFPIKEK